MSTTRPPSAGPTLVDVPIVFDVADGSVIHAPMVHATIGGVSTRLILDTGATDHGMTRELVDRVGVPMTPGEDGTDHTGAAVPSWSVGDLEVVIDGVVFGLHDVVAIDGPPPFADWAIGGFLSPQHLHPTARILVDLARQRLVVIEDGPEADARLMERAAPLRPVSLDRSTGTSTVAVAAAIEPFPEVVTMLDTGGRRTEFARSAVPALVDLIEDETALTGGHGVSGAAVVGAGVGRQTLRVGDARIAVPELIVRPSMDETQGLVGQDVLRGTALIVSADRARPVIWLVPPD